MTLKTTSNNTASTPSENDSSAEGTMRVIAIVTGFGLVASALCAPNVALHDRIAAGSLGAGLILASLIP